MALKQTQLKGRDVGDGSIGRADLNVTLAGEAVIRKMIDVASSGVKISSSTGVDPGTGDVGMILDWTLLDTRWATSAWAKNALKPTYTTSEIPEAATPVNLYYTETRVNANARVVTAYDYAGVGHLPLAGGTLTGILNILKNDGNPVGASFYNTNATGASRLFIGASITETTFGALFQYDNSDNSFLILNRKASTGTVSIGTTGGSLSIANTGKATFSGELDAWRFGFKGTSGDSYFYFPDTGAHTGAINFQAGFGSAAAGGSLSLYGQSHANSAGCVNIGLTATGAKFRIRDLAFTGGSEVASIDRVGNAIFSGNVTALNSVLTHPTSYPSLGFVGNQGGVNNFSLMNAITGISNTGFSIRNVTKGTNSFYIDGSDNTTFAGGIWATAATFAGSVIAPTIITGNTYIYTTQTQDGSGMYFERKGTTIANSAMRFQSSTSGDFTNYSQFIIDPTNGFKFTHLGSGNANATFDGIIYGSQLAIGTGTLRTDATLHISGAIGGNGRLTQMHPVASQTNADALNLIGSNDSAGNTQWWSWGVRVNGNYELSSSYGFNNPGMSLTRTGNVYFSSSVFASNATFTPNNSGVSTGLTVVNGDITTYRSGGNTGVIYLDNTGNRYLYYDGSKYILNGGQLSIADGRTAYHTGNLNRSDTAFTASSITVEAPVNGIGLMIHTPTTGTGGPSTQFGSIALSEYGDLSGNFVQIRSYSDLYNSWGSSFVIRHRKNDATVVNAFTIGSNSDATFLGNIYGNNLGIVKTTGTGLMASFACHSNFIGEGSEDYVSVGYAGVRLGQHFSYSRSFGWLGIGSSQGLKFYDNGDFSATGSGTFAGGGFNSQREIKNIHKDWGGNALNVISKFKIRDFNYKTRPDYDRTLGFIIDEIPKEIGEYALSGQERNSVNTYTLHGLSFKGLQEVKTKLDVQEGKLDWQSAKIILLEKRIMELEGRLN